MARFSSKKPSSVPHKRARVETPPQTLNASRVKGSPPPKPSTTSESAKPTKTAKGKEKAINADSSTTLNLPKTFKIAAGSYEKLLYGLEGSVSSADDELGYEIHLKPIFAFPAHVSCIKAVATSPQGGKWLATGSADEIVKVWDLRRKKEIGGLMHHEGSITHLSFPSRSHLLSASEDGTLCLFRARDWTVLRSLKGHKGRVNSVAVHPSGKVALSVGKDRMLRMWDLMRGRGSASTKLGKEGELVRWSVDGQLFVVQSQSTLDVYDTTMSLIHTISHPSRLHDVKFCKRVNGEGELLLAGAEDKKLSVYEISSNPDNPPRMIAIMTGHNNRVKAIDTLSISLPTSAHSTIIISTVSSDGNINIYDLHALPSPPHRELVEIKPAATYDTKGTRLTCVALADGDAVDVASAPGKRKRPEEDESEEGNDDDEWGAAQEEEEEEEEEETEEEVEED